MVIMDFIIEGSLISAQALFSLRARALWCNADSFLYEDGLFD